LLWDDNRFDSFTRPEEFDCVAELSERKAMRDQSIEAKRIRLEQPKRQWERSSGDVHAFDRHFLIRKISRR
jgi:hypothetical protein